MTRSRLNDPGFMRGGNSLRDASHSAAIAAAGTTMVNLLSAIDTGFCPPTRVGTEGSGG